MRLYVPVVDTENIDFEYKGAKIKTDDYANMVIDNVNQNAKNVNKMINRMQYSQHLTISDELNDYYSKRNYGRRGSGMLSEKFKYVLKPCDANIVDTKYRDIDESYFLNKIDSERMYIIISDINPDTIDSDAESEIRFWKEDSERILKDKDLTKKAKLKALPLFDFFIILNNRKIRLKDCKLIEMYMIKNHPYKFGIIVSETKYEN